MPSSLSAGEVERIAALANLELNGQEIELFTRQLGEILAYVEALRTADTTGVPPTAAVVTRHTADRADLVAPSFTIDQTLANAPDAEPGGGDGGFFKVPRIIG